MTTKTERKVTASVTWRGEQLTDIDVVGAGGWWGRAWLVEIGIGYSSIYYVVEAESYEHVIDEFSDSPHGHHIHVEEPDAGDYDPETSHYDGQGRLIDTDDVLIHGNELSRWGLDEGPRVPGIRYHADGLPSKGIRPERYRAWEDWADSLLARV